MCIPITKPIPVANNIQVSDIPSLATQSSPEAPSSQHRMDIEEYGSLNEG